MKTSYTCIRLMYENAYWAQNFYWELGLFHIAIRYCKIANRLYNCMMNYPADNVMMGEGKK